MGIHVALLDCTNGEEPSLLGRGIDQLMQGLPVLSARVEHAATPALSGAPVTPSQLRQMLSFVDPTFTGNPMWVGIAKGIRYGQFPVTNEVDGEKLLDEWCSGALWRERTDDQTFSVSTYHGRDELMQRTGDPPRHEGSTIGLGTIIKLARDGGYEGPVGSAADAFAHIAVEGQPQLASQLPHGQFAYVLRDPVEDASRPPITYRDEAHLWPNSAGGTVTQLIAGPKKHKTNLILAETFRLMLANRARVLVVTLEGQYGVTTQRIPTLAEHYGAELDGARGDKSRLEYLRGRFQVASLPGFALDNPDSVETFIVAANDWAERYELGGWTDIIIDTQHRAAGALEENSATDARTLWNAVERIRNGVTHDGGKLCNLTLLHHTGKDVSKGGRGSSADEAAVDQVLELKSDKDTRTASVVVRARKDGEDGIKVGFQIVSAGRLRVPILLPLKDEDYQRVSGADDRYANGRIGAALHTMGAVGRAKAVSSHVLAIQLLHQWGDVPRDPDEQEDKARSVSARLAEKIKAGRYRSYLMHTGGEPIKPYKWFLPEDDDE